ncbi:hypothetical protein BMF92_06650 [Serratia sp. OLBL1]|nr:hypothetical protein BMF87_08750 [Serratia sp. OLEL1]PII57841.1 hypothetical protein BMF85_12930 [Serratia sp. OLCL1]PII65088.1 hypothetical protein BMF92_06650 [Serratia sp. OLBL1]PII69822.1 hypothetical protein BMF88_23140 [Serratia sp. OLDL1]PII79137.1 hypothetical protein BMH23_01510 [Serratia sp. OLIL2]PII85482.1 hypothetical protein BMH24_00405 [Serratia sp. OLJL1]PII85613.1 hypothetical protein BMF91_23290 [Serratia sp. OLFL2]PIJ67524.1 hypothetical protein BK415_24820 [Serratia sp
MVKQGAGTYSPGGAGIGGMLSIAAGGVGHTCSTGVGVAKDGAVEPQAVRAKASKMLAIGLNGMIDPLFKLLLGGGQLALRSFQAQAQQARLLGQLRLFGQGCLQHGLIFLGKLAALDIPGGLLAA